LVKFHLRGRPDYLGSPFVDKDPLLVGTFTFVPYEYMTTYVPGHTTNIVLTSEVFVLVREDVAC
jgi:hypothetical protein